MDKSKIAFIFPGQGAQYVGMAKELCEHFKSADNVFEKANHVLGFDLKALCFDGPMEKLTVSAFCQPAILTHSIAAWEVLKNDFTDLNVAPCACAGLSLGEYSALAACGAINFEDALRLVHKRGIFMDEASRENPGAMSCILGLDLEKTQDLAKESGVQIANLNCPGQIVVSGTKESISCFNEMAQQAKAKRVISLDVSGPFHCSLMNPAVEKLKGILEDVPVFKPAVPFIPNVTGEFLTDVGMIKELLTKQVSHTTYWQKSIETLMKEGITGYFEFGPGKILRGLLGRIDRRLKVINLINPDDFSKLKEELGG
ncbi:MAG: ACP S-malonyltransferase [Candidatus Omnitrophica bacterium]|nr:ACP S-malonyltransferase [Candidatus Omnitrophota bacterium]